MGEVYLAEDAVLDRHVALKFLVTGLFDDLSAKDQLIREARAVAKLEHPNICAVYGLESIGDHDFIVMPYIEGETLDSLLQANPPDLDRLLDLSEQIATALAAAHSRGIIHRDIKPQNILIDKDGRPKILDFGLAKFVARTALPALVDKGPTVSQIGLVPGTVAYMSPEQTRGEKVDCATDIFSFGILLHQLVTGNHPFLRETREATLAAIASDEPRPLPDQTPRKLKEITRKCLDKSVTARYATGEDLVSDLRELRHEREHATRTAWHKQFRLLAIAATVIVAVILISGGIIWRRATRVHTLAILPIANDSGDSSKNYLTVGLTRTLFDQLSGLSRLKVILPTVVSGAASDSAVRAGNDLHVEAVLEGAMVNDNGNLRLRLRMINTADGKLKWEQSFDLQSLDTIALQNTVGANVTSGLGMWVMGADRKLLARHETDSQEALYAYMRGRHYYSLRDPENVRTAVKNFDQAVSLDPAFAEAYAGRADCTVLMVNVLYGPQPASAILEKAIYDAKQALEINPTLAEAHNSMGIANLRYYWNWQEAEAQFRNAIELQPDYAPAHYWYGNLLLLERRFDEGIQEAEIARSLDPYAPISELNYARALYLARRFNDAEAFIRNSIQRNPDYEPYLHQLSYILFQQQRFDDAIPLLEQIYAKRPLYAAATLGYAYAKAGRKSDAQRMLDFLDQSNTAARPTPPFEKMIIYFGLGDNDAAFNYLDKSYNDRFANIPFMTVDPLYDPIRSDPRFTQLAERLHLAP